MKKPIVERLRELDTQSVPFHEAHKLLLDEGYGEGTIIQGLYEFSYDGKPNQPKAQNKVKEYYESNPAEAKEMADSLLTSHAQEARYDRLGKMAADFAASRTAPGTHARAHYTQKWTSSAGIPFFSTLLVLAVTFALVLQFDLPQYLVYVVPLVYVVIFRLIDWMRNR